MSFLRCGRFVLSAEDRRTDEFVFFVSEAFFTKKLEFASRMFSKKTQEASRIECLSASPGRSHPL